MTPVRNNILRRRNIKKDIFTKNEDIEKRNEDIFAENSSWVFYLHSRSLEKKNFFTVKVNRNPLNTSESAECWNWFLEDYYSLFSKNLVKI